MYTGPSELDMSDLAPRPALLLITSSLAVGLIACSSSSADPGDEDGTSESGETGEHELVTYHADLRPLIERACTSCHQSGGIGPFALTDWEQVESFAPLLVSAIEGRSMPPWLPDDSCRAMRDSLALSQDEISLASAWRDDGFVEGDPADYVAPEPPPEFELGDPSMQLVMPVGYAPDAELVDDYRCLPMTNVFEDDLFVEAIDVVPDRRDLVHHVIVYMVGQNALEELDMFDAAEEGPGYACFGGPLVGIPDILGMWAPGLEIQRTPPGSAIRIPAGSRMILQVHYNTAAPDEPIGPDQSAVNLWTLPPGELPEEVINFVLFSNKTFTIPPGASEHVVETEMGVPASGTLVGMAPHMHTLGTAMEVEVASGAAAEACLMDIPRWDFNWQNMFYYEEPGWIDLEYGDEDSDAIVVAAQYVRADQGERQLEEIEEPEEATEEVVAAEEGEAEAEEGSEESGEEGGEEAEQKED